MAVAVGVVLLVVVVISVLVLSAQAEARCQLPEEPWLEWDGTGPEEMTLPARPKLRVHDVYMRTGTGWTDHPDREAVFAEKKASA